MRHTETVIRRYARLMLLVGIMLLSATSSFPQGAFQTGVQNGTIAGRILSVDGTPAANVRVAASAVLDNPVQNADGALLSIAQTDSAGRYRLLNVPPGRYYISAGQVEAPTYFPGVATSASATVLTVTSGAVVEGYDFRVVVPLSLKITGHVVRQDNGSNVDDEVYLDGRRRDNGENTDLYSGISRDSSFEFSNIRPGKYEISVEGKMLPVNVVLVDKDVTGVQLVIPAAVTVTGTVTVQGDFLQPSFQLRFDTADWSASTPGAAKHFRVGPDLDFTGSLFPADWRLNVTATSGPPAGYLIKSMTDGRTDLLTQTLKVAAGDSPRIAVTLALSSPPLGGKVSGQVTGRGATSTPRTVRLGGTAFINTLSAPVNPDGFFEFPMVVPGTYVIDAGLFSKEIVVGNTDLTNLAIAPPDLKDVPGEFVSIPPGEFMMGCSPEDNACADDEKPTHRVRITKGFEMGRFEVTQAQWEPVMGTTRTVPVRFGGATTAPAPGLPMIPVNWNQAQEFIRRLNALQDDYRYRLPTEAEWEYAARAGTTGAHPGELDNIAWHLGNSGGILHPGGQKLPNVWGLYDMLGNVSEWTQDLWASDFYANSPANDPAGPIAANDLQSPTAAATATRVQRGGALHDNNAPAKVRVSSRHAVPPGGGRLVSGFRLVREAIP